MPRLDELVLKTCRSIKSFIVKPKQRRLILWRHLQK
jgi:hypothetical protein